MERKISVTLTRKDLVARVAKHANMSVKECDAVVLTVLNCLGDMLMEADPELRIELRQHGVYTVKRTRARDKARNPATGDLVAVPGRRTVTFKPSRRIKHHLNQPLSELGYDELPARQ